MCPDTNERVTLLMIAPAGSVDSVGVHTCPAVSLPFNQIWPEPSVICAILPPIPPQ